MPYESVEEAIELAKMGRGSLVGSLFTSDDSVARDVALGTASHHGRLMIVNRESAKGSTGHGSPLPGLVHGGPGRAGGGEEMGGVRGALHYMQRTALQGSPTTLTRVSNEWIKGAAQPSDSVHPFRKYFDELEIGETLITPRRTVTEADVVNFAGISGDHFYAHMDDLAAKRSLFERRVAHGYFVLSAAAGLFVDPGEGPVLANYGLESLRFVKPVYPGDTIRVWLTVKQKTAKETPPEGIPQGVVAWDVEVTNQNDEAVIRCTADRVSGVSWVMCSMLRRSWSRSYRSSAAMSRKAIRTAEISCSVHGNGRPQLSQYWGGLGDRGAVDDPGVAPGAAAPAARPGIGSWHPGHLEIVRESQVGQRRAPPAGVMPALVTTRWPSRQNWALLGASARSRGD